MSAEQQKIVNPHFDHDRILWSDEYSGDYGPVSYDEQFDGQWKLFLEGNRGFTQHTGVETSDHFISDRIEELTGVPDFLHQPTFLERIFGRAKSKGKAQDRTVGGQLFLEPKFPIDYFKGKYCLDIGCGAGRWTRTLMALSAKVKSVDVSEHGLASTRRFNDDVERLNLFDIAERTDLHQRFDFTLCWGVVMCTHDPRLAFENVVMTVKPGGDLYIMVYAPTYHSSEFVVNARKRYHRECQTPDERWKFLQELVGDDKDNAINYLDMLHTFYNWTIDEATIRGWCREQGLGAPHFLNAAEPYKGAHHVLIKKPA